MMVATASYQKEKLEELEDVKSYLKFLVALEKGNIYRKFLQQLEIGRDGTVFAPYCCNKDKAFSNNHFGLSVILKYVFGYIQKEMDLDTTIGLRVSFDTLEDYVINACEILTDMNYMDGDRTVENDYGLEIYENPKNYSVVDFAAINAERDKFTNEAFKLSYNVPGILIDDYGFVAVNDINLVNDYNKMTPREKEAFFGTKASKILGLSSNGKVKK